MPSLADSVVFVFPAAPLSLAEKGYPESCRAWWHLDMEKITAAVASGQLRDQRNDMPPELPAAREALQGLLAQLREEYQLTMSQVVLGGFSQGSMLATDVAIRADQTLGGLVVWSGTLLCESEWREMVPNHKTLRVLQTHGEHDMVLPYVAAEWLRDMWSDFDIDVEFISFPGVHTIPREGLIGLIRMLQSM